MGRGRVNLVVNLVLLIKAQGKKNASKFTVLLKKDRHQSKEYKLGRIMNNVKFYKESLLL